MARTECWLPSVLSDHYNYDVIFGLISLLISGAALAVSYTALVYTARPRVRVKLVSGASIAADEIGELQFRAMMRSHLKRAAADLRFYVIFPPEVALIEARFGAALQRKNTEVREGKGSRHYLVVSGVRISRDEPFPYEDFIIRARMPRIPGTYRGWITCFAHNSTDDCGVSHFQLSVLGPESENASSRIDE
jgi:hypothetical protein